MSDTARAIVAVILAGGRGERLGGALKSGLVVGGTRLLERVAGVLSGASPLLVAHGRHDPELLGLSKAMVPVADLAGEYAGPLAGVAGAIAWCVAQPAPPLFLLSVAVDTPFLPADFQPRLMASIGDHAAALAAYGAQDYPTNALWRLQAIAALPQQIVAGTAPRSLKRLAAGLDAVRVAWPATASGDPFANANTPEELAALQRRAAGGDA